MLKFLLLISLSSNIAFADTCKGISDCTKLYEKLTNKKLETKFVPSNLTTLNEELTISKDDAEEKFVKYINEAGISIQTGSSKFGPLLSPSRRGAGITAPVFRVNEEILNKVKNQNERVNLVYSAKVYPKHLIDVSVRKLMSQGKDTSVNIVEFSANKIIFVSDLGTNAYQIIKRIEELDK